MAGYGIRRYELRGSDRGILRAPETGALFCCQAMREMLQLFAVYVVYCGQFKAKGFVEVNGDGVAGMYIEAYWCDFSLEEIIECSRYECSSDALMLTLWSYGDPFNVASTY